MMHEASSSTLRFCLAYNSLYVSLAYNSLYVKLCVVIISNLILRAFKNCACTILMQYVTDELVVPVNRAIQP